MSGLITDYPGFRLAIKARRMELGLSQLALDELAGVQSGYTGKIEIGLKNMGDMSMAAILGALGMGLMPSACEHREMSAAAKTSRESLKKMVSLRGAKGGRAAMRALTPEQRREKARKAALSRWGKRRLSKAAAHAKARDSKKPGI